MKKNLYYAAVFQRKSVIKSFLISIGVLFASWPRLIIEVFLRRDMGQRYFNIMSSIFLFFLLGPWGLKIVSLLFPDYYTPPFLEMIKDRPSLFLFDLAFLGFSIKRYLEIRLKPGVFDFARFSQSTGIPLEIFRDINLFGKPATIRQVSIILEPALACIVGIVFLLCASPVGSILVICSIVYSLSYYADYSLGDDFVIDKIDEMICNEELSKSFLEGRGPEETRGFQAFAQAPTNEDFARQVVDSFIVDKEPSEAY